jgi:hypothetical protein
MSAVEIIGRLDGVKNTGHGRWIARCPAHNDRRPSLGVREADDGRVLLYCRAGCETSAILDSIGATWADLFLPRSRTDSPARRRREHLVHPADALSLLSHEVSIVVLLSGDMARGLCISEADRARLIVAASRIAKAASLCN